MLCRRGTTWLRRKSKTPIFQEVDCSLFWLSYTGTYFILHLVFGFFSSSWTHWMPTHLLHNWVRRIPVFFPFYSRLVHHRSMLQTANSRFYFIFGFKNYQVGWDANLSVYQVARLHREGKFDEQFIPPILTHNWTCLYKEHITRCFLCYHKTWKQLGMTNPRIFFARVKIYVASIDMSHK